MKRIAIALCAALALSACGSKEEPVSFATLEDARAQARANGEYNDDKPGFFVKPGDRIAQALVLPVERVNFIFADELSDTERGTGGFGSTGKD